MSQPNIANDQPWHTHAMRIESIRDEIDAVITMELKWIEERAGRHWKFAPGQFNMLYVPGCGEVAISLSGAPHATTSHLVHTIRRVGRVTEAIFDLGLGDVIGIRGPFGKPWPLEEAEDRDLILVAGGIGLAPLRPVLYNVLAHRDRYRKVVLFYGARTPDLLLYTEEYARWKQHDIEIQVTVDRAEVDWPGRVGVVPLLMDRWNPLRADQTSVFMCGPEIMMQYAAKSAMRRGIDDSSIWVSMERNMQCAVGQCGHCQLGPTFVCKNGPVFRYDEIAPWLRTRDL
ncbi:MAG: FAD/NAD(P)-binding protein [Pirellulales bacterium]